MQEEWRPVVGHEGQYEVSDLGNVRSVDRVRGFPAHTTRAGVYRSAGTRALKGKALKPGPMASGHLSVAIGKGNARLVHQPVMEAFGGPCPEGQEVLHRNGVSGDNRRDNLRYGTRAENLRDDVHHGKRLVTVEQIRHLRRVYATLPRGEKKVLAKKLGISASHAGNIAIGRDYKEVV